MCNGPLTSPLQRSSYCIAILSRIQGLQTTARQRANLTEFWWLYHVILSATEQDIQYFVFSENKFDNDVSIIIALLLQNLTIKG